MSLFWLEKPAEFKGLLRMYTAVWPRPHGDPSWYSWNAYEGHWFCELCSKFATPDHVNSMKHRRRTEEPAYWLSHAHAGSSVVVQPSMPPWPQEVPDYFPPAPDETNLPPGWARAFSPVDGKWYYYRVDGGRVIQSSEQWDPPRPELLALTMGPQVAAAPHVAAVPVAPNLAAAPHEAAVPTAAPTPLPPGWHSMLAADTNRVFWYHVNEEGTFISGSETWVRPDIAPAA